MKTIASLTDFSIIITVPAIHTATVLIDPIGPSETTVDGKSLAPLTIL
jgi:hypothetical protein